MRILLIILVWFMGCNNSTESIPECPEHIYSGYCPNEITIQSFDGLINEQTAILILNESDTMILDIDFSIHNVNTINSFYSYVKFMNPQIQGCNSISFIFENYCNATQASSISLTLHMHQWKLSSSPIQGSFSTINLNHIAEIDWYNPYNDILTNDIWPDIETSAQLNNSTTKTLFLDIYNNHLNQNGSYWAGITHNMYDDYHLLNEDNSFLIWMNTDSVIDELDFSIQLGDFNEDLNQNGILDTEDHPIYGPGIGDGILSDGEDTGLDGCFDEYEDGNGGCQTELNDGEEDPNGDNWNYNNINNYSHINELEGNKNFMFFNYPDTEDLDRDRELDTINSYFSYTIDLNNLDSSIIDEFSILDGVPTGWKLYKIPFSLFMPQYDIVEPHWSNIRNIRLLITSDYPIINNNQIKIAKLEITN